MRTKIYRAGMLPYYFNSDKELEFLFMKPSNSLFGGDEFQIAKGKTEDGESDKETALREAKEELGLRMNNVERLFKVGVFLGRTTIFICQVKNKEDFDEPHFETCAVKWMTVPEFVNHGRPIHTPVVIQAEKFIKDLKLVNSI